MGKIVQAMQGWLKYSNNTPGHDALAYIETGDPKALAALSSKPHDAWLHWARLLAEILPDPDRWDDEARRAIETLATVGSLDRIGAWISNVVHREKSDESAYELVRVELARTGIGTPNLSAITMAFVEPLERGGRPTSAGRHLLALSDAELKAAWKASDGLTRYHTPWPSTRIARLLLANAPERLKPLLGSLLARKTLTPELCEAILENGADRYEGAVADAWAKAATGYVGFQIGRVISRLDPIKYRDRAREFARAVFADKQECYHHAEAALWMIATFGEPALDEIVALLRGKMTQEGKVHEDWQLQTAVKEIAEGAVKALGVRALPAVLAALESWASETHQRAIVHLMAFEDGSHAGRIRSELERGLGGDEGLKANRWRTDPAQDILPYIALAARWDASGMADHFWGLIGHKSKAVREASARALGRLGAEAVPRATEMLADKKTPARAASVVILSTTGTPEALKALEARVDDETDEDVRDAILITLDAALAAEGREVGREEIDRRIARAAPKLKAPVAKWLDEAQLPALKYRDGEALGPTATRYLLFRQSRAKEIKPDVEARPLYGLIDPKSAGDFALQALRQFASSKADAKDRWALGIAGLMGDHRTVPVLAHLIDSWASSSRGKMAEYAVQALALMGSDAALMSVDAVATRYRSKQKNVGAAAEEAFRAAADRLGVTVDELGDRVVPWLGFEPGKPRLIEAAGKAIEASIGPDFKLRYRDPEKNKRVATLPKSLPKEVLAEFKDLGATLREVAKAQKLRLENLMVRQHRWPTARWRELFLNHPVLFLPFATRLAWRHYDESGAPTGAFRALEDRTLTDPADEPFELPEGGSVGIVHPLELDDAALQAWRTHISDYEVESPFAQLERPVVRVADAQRDVKISKAFTGTSLNAMTFRGRAEKLGWVRGSVTDGGGVDSYRKVFAGAEAFIGVDGMYMGIGMDDSIQLGDLYFVKAGAVDVGSYVYDNPSDEKDPRLVAFGDVPPVIFSEALGDLKRIAGQAGAEEADEAEG